MTNNNSLVTWFVFIVAIGVVTAMVFTQYKYISTELKVAKARNVASALTTATAENYTRRKMDLAQGVPLNNCQEVMSISGNQLPSGYLIQNRDIPPDVMEVCQLQATAIWPIAFNVIGIH
jgi:hypothetical protein